MYYHITNLFEICECPLCQVERYKVLPLSFLLTDISPPKLTKLVELQLNSQQ